MSIIIRGMRKFGGVRMRQIFTKPQYDQYLYALEYYNTSTPEKIYRIDLSDGSETLIVEQALTQYHPEFAVSKDNVIYPAGYREITAYDGLTGNTLDSTAVNNVYRTTSVTKDGVLYTMLGSSNRLDVYDVNDLSTILFSQMNIQAGDATTSSKTYQSMDTATNGDVFIGGVADDHYIHRYDSSANLVWDYEAGDVNGTYRLGATPDNGVVFINNNAVNDTVIKLNESGDVSWESPAFSTNLSFIAVDYDGNSLVASSVGNFIGKVDASGNKLWEISLSLSGDIPQDIECDMDGNIYLSTTNANIHKFDADGNLLWSNTSLTAPDSDFYIIEVTGMSGNEKWG